MRCWRVARQILLELVLSARHEVLIRTRALRVRAGALRVHVRALRAVAVARAIRFMVRASTNLSRAVLLGLFALIILRADLVDREPTPTSSANVEIALRHPAPAPDAPADKAETAAPTLGEPAPPPAQPAQPADAKPPAPFPLLCRKRRRGRKARSRTPKPNVTGCSTSSPSLPSLCHPRERACAEHRRRESFEASVKAK